MPFFEYYGSDVMLAFVDSASNGTSWSTSLGTANAARLIIVAVGSAGGTPPTGVTVDGVAATLAISNGAAKIWYAQATANVTGTTTLTGGSSATLQGIGVYAAYNLPSLTPSATGTGADHTTVVVPANGFVIGCAERTGGTISGWLGVTRDYTATVSGDDFSSASTTVVGSASVLATATGAGTTAVAAWG
jgi:hypothetical protein